MIVEFICDMLGRIMFRNTWDWDQLFKIPLGGTYHRMCDNETWSGEKLQIYGDLKKDPSAQYGQLHWFLPSICIRIQMPTTTGQVIGCRPRFPKG